MKKKKCVWTKSWTGLMWAGCDGGGHSMLKREWLQSKYRYSHRCPLCGKEIEVLKCPKQNY